MQLAHNWKKIIRRAWSIRLILLAAVLSAAEVSLPLIGEIVPIPVGMFAALSALATAGAFIARIAAQKDF